MWARASPFAADLHAVRRTREHHVLRRSKGSMDLNLMALEGPTVRLEPLGREHVDGLCAVGLDPEL